jgi:uncharacterized protein
MTDESFRITETNRVRQVARRGSYDRDEVFRILDQAMVAIVAFSERNQPTAIPTLFGRRGDELLFHGSSKSRLMHVLVSGQPVCIATMMVDGIVLAKSLFHHSMNYRSAVVFGCGKRVEDETERSKVLQIITDKMLPGRWGDARLPNEQEMKATCVATVTIDLASAKVRTGGPIEDEADTTLHYWSGVLPLQISASKPIAADTRSNGIAIPSYLETWLSQFPLAGENR